MAIEETSSQFRGQFIFTRLFQTFQMARQPSKLIIGLMAIAAICTAGWLMDFSKSVISIDGRTKKITELQIYLNTPDNLPDFIAVSKEKSEHTGVFSTLWAFGSKKFHGILICLSDLNIAGIKIQAIELFQAAVWALRYHFIYSAIFFLIILVVISISGGAICRISALQFAQSEKPGLVESLHFSISNFGSFFMAPLVPMAIILIMGLFVFLLGIAGNIPYAGELIIGIFAPAALFFGALIAILATGTAAGLNLLFPAIAYDGLGHLDAFSRAFHYICKRPWRMLFYTTVAAVYGAICYMFVRFLVYLVLITTYLFLIAGVWTQNSNNVNKLKAIWPQPEFMNLPGSSNAAAGTIESVAAELIYLSILLIIGLLVAFVISFYFSANTVIYALMRKKVDGIEIGEVYNPLNQSLSNNSAVQTFYSSKSDVGD